MYLLSDFYNVKLIVPEHLQFKLLPLVKCSISELTEKIGKSNSAKIINKVGSLNDDELISKNRDVRVRTKSKEEFLEMLKRIRSTYEMDDMIGIYEL